MDTKRLEICAENSQARSTWETRIANAPGKKSSYMYSARGKTREAVILKVSNSAQGQCKATLGRDLDEFTKLYGCKKRSA